MVENDIDVRLMFFISASSCKRRIFFFPYKYIRFALDEYKKSYVFVWEKKKNITLLFLNFFLDEYKKSLKTKNFF